MTDRHDLDSPEGYIAFFTEVVADPENKLGIARMVAAEMLADGDRVRRILADHPGAADKFLAAQARLLRPEATGTPPNPATPASEAHSSNADPSETTEEET